jgi:hypothetical protein
VSCLRMTSRRWQGVFKRWVPVKPLIFEGLTRDRY